jgi:hypothetical protein
MHKAGAPGSLSRTDGQYETSLANGRVLALGLAYNERDSRIVQSDLARLASAISG